MAILSSGDCVDEMVQKEEKEALLVYEFIFVKHNVDIF